MRAFEILFDLLEPDARLFTTGDAETILSGFPKPERHRLNPAGEKPKPGDVVLTVAGDPAAVKVAVAATPDGVRAAVALTTPLDELAVAATVDAVLESGGQVRALVPLKQAGVTACLVVDRSSEPLAPLTYLRLDPSRHPLDDAAARRLVAEWAVEGAVTRARLARVEHAEGSVASLAAKAQRAEQRAAALESSNTFAVGKAIATMPRRPVAAGRDLVSVLRRARAGRRSRG